MHFPKGKMPVGFVASIKSLFGVKSMDSYVSGSYPMSYDPFEAQTASGQIVNSWTALQQATVLQCVTVLMNGVSQIPFNLMRSKGRKKTSADNHPLHWLLS